MAIETRVSFERTSGLVSLRRGLDTTMAEGRQLLKRDFYAGLLERKTWV